MGQARHYKPILLAYGHSSSRVDTSDFNMKCDASFLYHILFLCR